MGLSNWLQKSDSPGVEIQPISLASIEPNPFQTRALQPEIVEALARSIRERGLQQYPKVWCRNGTWILCYGHHRVAAARQLGWETIPCRVESRVDLPDEELAVESLTENLHRAELSAVERAEAFRTLAKTFSLTAEQIAEKVGVDERYVRGLLSVLDAPAQVLAECREQRLGNRVCLSLQRLCKSGGEGEAIKLLEKLRREEVSRDEVETQAQALRNHSMKSSKRVEAASDYSWFFREGKKFGLRSVVLEEGKTLSEETWQEMGRNLAHFFKVAGLETVSWQASDVGIRFERRVRTITNESQEDREASALTERGNV